MSLIESLASVLREMTLTELALALIAVLAYSLAINGSYGGALRGGAASVAFAASVGFTTLTPGWMSAVMFLALAILAIAAFAALAWAISSALGLGGATPAMAMADEPFSTAASPQPVRLFAPNTSPQPL